MPKTIRLIVTEQLRYEFVVTKPADIAAIKADPDAWFCTLKKPWATAEKFEVLERDCDIEAGSKYRVIIVWRDPHGDGKSVRYVSANSSHEACDIAEAQFLTEYVGGRTLIDCSCRKIN